MHFQSGLILIPCFVFAIAVEAHAQEGGEYDLGDCLVPQGVFSCRIYLTTISRNGNGNGIDYLAEVSCPGCVLGKPVGIGPDGKTEYSDPTCQEDKTWSNPNDDNLDSALTYYDPAEPGETGAEVTGFDELNCWSGGNCLTGSCEEYETGLIDAITGAPLLEWRCHRDGADIKYIVKLFGNTCTGEDEYAAGSSGGGSSGSGSSGSGSSGRSDLLVADPMVVDLPEVDPMVVDLPVADPMATELYCRFAKA